MYDTVGERYEKLLSRYVAIAEKSLKARMVAARDKEAVAKEISNEIAYMDTLMTATSRAKELLNDFIQQHNRGEAIDAITKTLKNRYGSSLEKFKHLIESKKELQVHHPTDDAERVSLLASNESMLLKFLVRYMGVRQLKARLPIILKLDNTSVEIKPVELYAVQWTGNRDNKNEFVQLVYALYQAGYLNNGQGEITKIVESLASILKVGLGKSWQSNLSSSIHKSKKDYEPPIFEKIRQAYLKYADELITTKKANR